MGMDKRKMARLILPSVKFCSEPFTASLNKRKIENALVVKAFI
jgi:hypothetical protein